MRKASLYGLVSLAVVALVVAPAAWAAGNTVSVVVDTAASQSAVRDLLGVNVPPVFDAKTAGTTYSAVSLYTAFGVSQARYHDSGIDLCTIYKAATRQNVGVTPATTVLGCTITGNGVHYMWTPTSSADADLNNPNNYDFTTADDYIKKTLDSGAKLYLGLSQNTNGPNDTNDPVAWAKVAANIYKHVIGVFKPTAGVAVDPSAIEIHNEPDGAWWRGDAATFITLYKEMTTRVRAVATAAGKTAKVGGPGFTKSILNTSQITTNPAYNFINVVGASSLDFYSAHLYDSCSAASMQTSATFLRNLRSLVNTQGGSALPLQITEWNIGLGNECGNSYFADQRNQSYASGALTLMQDTALNIQAAHYYAGVTVMSLFDFTAVTGAVRVNPAAWAFWAHARLSGTTMLGAQVCQGTTCANGYAADAMPLLVLAGKASSDAQEIVVTNDGSAAVSYDLQVKGLAANRVDITIATPPSGTKDVAVSGSPLSVTANDLATLMNSPARDNRVSQAVTGGSVTLSLTIPARTVQMIEVRTAGTSVTTPAQSDCVFNWAERNYPQYFAPANAASVSAAPYYYRYYTGTKNNIVTATDNQLYVYGQMTGNQAVKVGSMASFLTAAGCWQ